MKPSLIILFAISAIGCASKQACPKIPETACGQCAMQIKDGTVDIAKATAVLAIEGTDAAIAILRKAETYLQEKIVEWKKNNPELVEDAEKKLAELRAKIREYEKKARDYAKKEINK